MKKIFYLLSILFVIASTSNAQSLIAVEHGSSTTFYTRLDSALERAVNGDRIYLPGGSYPGFQLNKNINIIGAGFDLDSSVSTNPTYINGNIDILTGSNGAIIEGLWVNGYINIGTNSTNNIVSNIIIKRCKLLNGIYVNSFTGAPNTSNNFSFMENIIGGCQLGTYSSYFFFSNNIFYSQIQSGNQSAFKNNVFTYGNPLSYMINCTFQNNIINGWSNSSCSGNNTYYNNWGVPNGFLSCGDGFGMNNLATPSAFADIFIQQWYNTIPSSFKLKTTSPLRNAGTDGTDIGIFGGAYPWKEGSIPANPHIQFKSIAPKTTNQNTLPIQIKVKAQDN